MFQAMVSSVKALVNPLLLWGRQPAAFDTSLGKVAEKKIRKKSGLLPNPPRAGEVVVEAHHKTSSQLPLQIYSTPPSSHLPASPHPLRHLFCEDSEGSEIHMRSEISTLFWY